MISETEVEKACEFLRTNARHLAKAKAERVYLEEFKRSKKALLMQQADKGTVADREAFAYRHPDYLELLEGLKVAVEMEERLRWMMTAAMTKCDLFRTQEASNRIIDKSHR